jgi:Flp pilus assembly protein CpaB
MSRLSWQRKARADTAPRRAGNGDGRVRIAPREGSADGWPPLRSRRLLQPVPLTGFALMLVGLLVVLGYGAAAGQRTPVLIAARNLPAGTLLQASDLRSARIGADGVVLSALVREREQASVVGRRLATQIGPGEPLTRSELASLAATPAAFTLAVPAEHALGGQLQPGARVTVLATFTTSNGGATTRALARHLLVVAVGAPPTLADPNQTTIPVTVALADPSIAARLALANSVAKIDLLRESAGSSAAPIPAASAPGAGQ